MILIGGLKITASRWPGQVGYDWRGMTNNTAILNNGARFGGGWKYCLGFSTAGWSENGGGISVDLLFGNININWRTPAGRKADDEWENRREKMRTDEAVKKAVAANDEAQVTRRNEQRDNYHAESVKRDVEIASLKQTLANLASAINHRRHEIAPALLTFLKISLDDAEKVLKVHDDEIPF